MKSRDIEGALNLLISLSDRDAVTKLLNDLDAKNKEVTAKLKINNDLLGGIKQGNDALDARYEEASKRDLELTRREDRLKDAEQQHQFTMDGERKGLTAQKEALAEQAKELASESKRVSAWRDELAGEFGKREKALAKRELDAVKRDEDLTAREQAWKQGVRELEITKAKLKELAA